MIKNDKNFNDKNMLSELSGLQQNMIKMINFSFQQQ